MKTIIGLHAPVILDPKYLWFMVHFYVGLIPNSSGQMAELIVYIIPLELICIESPDDIVIRYHHR